MLKKVFGTGQIATKRLYAGLTIFASILLLAFSLYRFDMALVDMQKRSIENQLKINEIEEKMMKMEGIQNDRIQSERNRSDLKLLQGGPLTAPADSFSYNR